MSRFIDLDIAYVNVDYITRVEGHPDGSAEVYMIDGTMYRCKDFDWAAFEGANHIVGIVPCKDLDADFEDAGEHIRVPVANLAITASGDVIPLMVIAGDYESDFGNYCGLHERWGAKSIQP